MEKFVIYITAGLSGETNCIKNILRKLGTSLRRSELDQLCTIDIASTLSLLKINLCFITNNDCANSATSWKSFEYLDEFNDSLDTCSQDLNVTTTKSQLQNDFCNLADKLHMLADTLPLPGTYLLDIFWDWSTDDSWQIEDHLELFAALKRCVAWHNARILLIGGKLQDRADDWLHILNASVIKPSDNIDDVPLDCLWYGSLDLTENEETPDCQVRLPGFCLTYDKHDSLNTTIKANGSDGPIESERVSLSSRMEFVAYCQLDTVPAYVIQSGKFGLKTVSEVGPLQPSKKWLTSVTQDNKIGVVLRLRYIADDWISYFYSDFAPSSDSWKKALVDEDFDDILPLMPPESPQYLFLLVGDSSKLFSEACLYPLKDAASLNGIAAHHMSLQSSVDATTVNEVGCQLMLQFLESLPCYSKDDFVSANKMVQELQKEVIQAWITEEVADSGSMPPPEDIHDFMTLIKEEVMKQLKIPFSYTSFTLDPDNFCKENGILQAEHLVDPNDWPERKSLLNREIAAEKRKRLKSCEALAPIFASSPDTSLHLSCTDFLKHFSTIVIEKSKPTQPLEAETSVTKDGLLHSFRHSYYTGKDLNEYPWPDVKELQFPDIYYNKDEVSELLEATSSQVKDKCVPQETASTFVCTTVSELKMRHSSEVKSKSLNIKPMLKSDDSNKTKSVSLSPRKCIQSKSYVHTRRPGRLHLKHSGRQTPRKIVSHATQESCLQSHKPVVKRTPKIIASAIQVPTVCCEAAVILSPRRSPRIKRDMKSAEKDKNQRKGDSVASSPQRSLPNTENTQKSILSPRRTPKRSKSPLKLSGITTPRRSPRQHKSLSSFGGNSASKLTVSCEGDTLPNPESSKSPRGVSKQKRLGALQRCRHGSGSSTSSYCELSQKHLGKLRCAVVDALEAHGIDSQHELYNVCGKKLIRICKAFALDVIGRGRTSILMRQIADAHVKQVISFEKQLGPRHW